MLFWDRNVSYLLQWLMLFVPVIFLFLRPFIVYVTIERMLYSGLSCFTPCILGWKCEVMEMHAVPDRGWNQNVS